MTVLSDEYNIIDEYEDYINKLKNDDVYRSYTAVCCQESFKSYLLRMFYIINGSKFQLKPFHEQVIQKLEDLVLGYAPKRNLALCLPVGSGKSIITEYFITWCFARTINCMFCYISHSDRLITKLSKEARDIVDHPMWILMFNANLKKDDRKKINFSFENAKNRTGMTAGTIGGGITGLDAGNPSIKGFSGALIIDDPMDAGEAHHPNAREECIRHYDDKLSTRRRTTSTPTILIMQRLHMEDLVGWAINNEPEDWDILAVPAVDKDGVSFWPERYSLQEMQKIERINAYKFKCQYQQDPIAQGGSMIKSEYFNFYQELPDIKKLFMVGDTAQKTKEHNDYSVFTVWGSDGPNLYLIDLIRGKWEAPDLLVKCENIVKRYRVWNNKRLREIVLEDKSSGTGLIQTMKRTCSVPIKALQVNKDKVTRVDDALPHMANGYVFLPYSKDYGFNKELISECEQFARDMSHKHDDIVDNITMAIQYISRRTSIYDAIE